MSIYNAYNDPNCTFKLELFPFREEMIATYSNFRDIEVIREKLFSSTVAEHIDFNGMMIIFDKGLSPSVIDVFLNDEVVASMGVGKLRPLGNGLIGRVLEFQKSTKKIVG